MVLDVASIQDAMSLGDNAAMNRAYSLLVLFVWWPAGGGLAADAPPVEFTRDVRPILESSCWKCHGPHKQQGGLRFDRREDALRVGDSGQRAVTPGRIAQSELIRRVEATDDSQCMPSNTAPLGAAQIRILRAWIEQGAKWPEAAVSSQSSRSELAVTDVAGNVLTKILS